jgi:hypothetical protein
MKNLFVGTLVDFFKKRGGAIFAFASLIYAIYVFTGIVAKKQAFEREHPTPKFEQNSAPSFVDKNGTQANPEINAKPQPASSIAQQYATVMGPPEDTAKIQNWFTNAGYPYWNNNTDYSGYSDEALNDLAKSGDIQALLTLGDRKDYDSAKELFLKAASLGSTAAIEKIGAITEAHFIKGWNPPEENKIAAKEALAWYNAAALRGDRFPNFLSGSMSIRVNKIELTDDERRAIYERSQAIYTELEQKRTELNLGKFDNSVPDVVSSYFDRIESGGRKLVYP